MPKKLCFEQFLLPKKFDLEVIFDIFLSDYVNVLMMKELD